MTENELSKIIVDIYYKIHTKLGPGLLESDFRNLISRRTCQCSSKTSFNPYKNNQYEIRTID